MILIRKNSNGSEIFSLFSKIYGSHREELISGIETMKIKYGVAKKNGKDIESYLIASKVSDWKLINSVQIALILNSVDAAVNRSVAYKFERKDTNA